MSFACLLQQLFCEINSITENQKLDAAIAKKKSKKSCATSYLKDTKKNILSNFMLSKNGCETNHTNSSGFYQFKKWEKEIACYLSGGRKDKFISGMTMRMSMSENHFSISASFSQWFLQTYPWNPLHLQYQLMKMSSSLFHQFLWNKRAYRSSQPHDFYILSLFGLDILMKTF